MNFFGMVNQIAHDPARYVQGRQALPCKSGRAFNLIEEFIEAAKKSGFEVIDINSAKTLNRTHRHRAKRAA